MVYHGANICWGFAGLLIVIFNAYFLHIIIFNRSIWTESNLFIGTQLVASFGLGLFSLTVFFCSLNWTINETDISCPITSVCMDMLVTQSLWSLCGIAFSRKRSLLDDHVDSKPCRAITHFILGWVFSIGLGLTNTSPFTDLQVSATGLICQPNSGLLAGVHITLLFIFMVWISTIYYHILRRLQSLSAILVNDGANNEGFGFENNKIRIQQKKASMRILVILMALIPISYLPYIFVYALGSFHLGDSPIMEFVSFSALLLNSITNPFLYAWRVPQIRSFTLFKEIPANIPPSTDLSGWFWSTEAQSWNDTFRGSTKTGTFRGSTKTGTNASPSQKTRRTPFSINSALSFQDNDEVGTPYHKFQDQEHSEIRRSTVDYQGNHVQMSSISQSQSAVFTSSELDGTGLMSDRTHNNIRHTISF